MRIRDLLKSTIMPASFKKSFPRRSSSSLPFPSRFTQTFSKPLILNMPMGMTYCCSATRRSPPPDLNVSRMESTWYWYAPLVSRACVGLCAAFFWGLCAWYVRRLCAAACAEGMCGHMCGVLLGCCPIAVVCHRPSAQDDRHPHMTPHIARTCQH